MPSRRAFRSAPLQGDMDMTFNFPPVAIAPRFGFCVGVGLSRAIVAFTFCAGRCVAGQPWTFYRTVAWAKRPWPSGSHWWIMRSH